MKKLFILIASSVIMGGASALPLISVSHSSDIHAPLHWDKSADGTWMGTDKMWYKLNTKDLSLWNSKDGKEWKKATNGLWSDKAGDLIKINAEKKLVWSTDGGKTFTPVPESKWEGADGNWYKFDEHWDLWVMHPHHH